MQISMKHAGDGAPVPRYPRDKSRRYRGVPLLLLLVLVPGLLLAAAAGCGGGGDEDNTVPIVDSGTPGGGSGGNGGPSATPSTSRFAVGIHWGPRSRSRDAAPANVGGPSSALSATVTLHGANPSGSSDVSFTVNRPDGTASTYQTYTSPTEARVGSHWLTVRFFALPDGGGDVVGVAPTGADLGADGGLLATIATIGAVRSVEVRPGQSMTVGEAKEIAFTARNSDGAVLAITPGSGFARVVSGSDTLEASGISAIGKKPGAATVSVSVDAFSSPATAVQVVSNAVVKISPAPSPSLALSIGSAQSFSASVVDPANAQASQAVIWRVQEGDAGGRITGEGVYSAPGAPGTYHIIATSMYDPTKSATVTVVVQSGTVPIIVD